MGHAKSDLMDRLDDVSRGSPAVRGETSWRHVLHLERKPGRGMRKTTETRAWNQGTPALICWLLLFSAFWSAPSLPLSGRSSDVPVLAESLPLPVSTVPGGNDGLQEPSDPDAEPAARIETTSAVLPVIATRFVEEIQCPGFASVPEKPPQV